MRAEIGMHPNIFLKRVQQFSLAGALRKRPDVWAIGFTVTGS